MVGLSICQFRLDAVQVGARQFPRDAWHGDEDPQGVRDWLHGIMYGPAPKGGGH